MPRLFLVALLALTVSVAVLVGCGSEESSTATAPASPETTTGAPGATAAGAIDPELDQGTRRFIGLLVEESFGEAAELFDAQMAQAITPEQLEELWVSLESQVGLFQQISGVEQTEEQGYRVMYATTEFEQQTVRIKVVYDSQGLIAGLFFLPAEGDSGAAGAEYETAPYVDPSSFSEVELETGAAGWPLPGTLTVPEGGGPFPAVVLVHGSGPNDRDETIGPNKPFRDLAEGLASRGVAVLRYEKRTKEHAERLGDGSSVTVEAETVDDAVAALADLAARPEVDPSAVYVVGHSLGATLAPRIARAAEAEGIPVAGVVLLAGAARPLEDVVLDQVTYLAEVDGEVTAEEQANLDELRAAAARVRRGDFDADTMPDLLPLGISPAYWSSLSGYDPVAEARSLGLPVLVLQGGRDYQVTDADYDLWQEGLAGAPGVEFSLYEDLNHLFIPGTGPSEPAEYNEPGHVDERVVDAVSRFVGGE